MSVTWTGLESFKQELRNLPAELTGEASNIVIEAAKTTERETKAVYPIGPQGSPKSNSGNPPGGLRRGVTTTVEAINRGGVSARVKSNAKHAHLFENGTGLRRNRHGASRGKMPQAPDAQRMIPIAIRARRQMYVKLIDMVQRHGLVVTQS